MQAEDEPLSIGALRISPEAEAELRTAWWRRGQRSLFRHFEDFRRLLEEVSRWVDGGAGGSVGGWGCHGLRFRTGSSQHRPSSIVRH